MLYRFGPFTLRESACVLERDGNPVPLRRQAHAVLHYLVARRDRLVSKRELFDEIWAEARVTENALAQCLAEIRRVLGDDGCAQRMIRTRHGVGVQFVGDVTAEQEATADAGPAGASRPLVNRIALRPFAIAGDAALDAELALEIEHELLRQLVKKSPIPVIHARSSCAATADADGDAAFSVEGRLQCFAGFVRLRLRLIETATRSVVWAERYDARIEALVDDEDGVTRSASEGLLRATVRAMSQRTHDRAPENLPDAELAVRALDLFYRREHRANQLAIAHFAELAARGSRALSVHAYLGRAHYRNIYYLWDDEWTHSIEQVRIAAAECLKIDERDPAGPLLLAFTRVFEGDGEQAVALAERVVNVWPDMPEARCLHGDFLILLGYSRDAIAAVKDALRGKRLEDARGEYAAALSAAYFNAESYADARKMARRAIVDNPNSVMNHVVSAVSAWHLKEHGAVKLEVERLRRLRPEFSHRPFQGILASTPVELRRHFLGSLEATGLLGPEWRADRAAAETAPSSHFRVNQVRAAR